MATNTITIKETGEVKQKVKLLWEIFEKAGLIEDYFELGNKTLKAQIKKGFKEYKLGKTKPIGKLLQKYRLL